jgi:hypothetical protein
MLLKVIDSERYFCNKTTAQCCEGGGDDETRAERNQIEVLSPELKRKKNIFFLLSPDLNGIFIKAHKAEHSVEVDGGKEVSAAQRQPRSNLNKFFI